MKEEKVEKIIFYIFVVILVLLGAWASNVIVEFFTL